MMENSNSVSWRCGIVVAAVMGALCATADDAVEAPERSAAEISRSGEASVTEAPALDEGPSAAPDPSDPGLVHDPQTGQAVVDGVVPSPPGPADPAQAAKDMAVAAYRAHLGAELADDGTASALDLDAADAGEGDATVAATVARSVRIRGEKQQCPAWCVPASSRMTLSALMSSPPNQPRLAGELRTTPCACDPRRSACGTAMGNVPGVLNRHQSRNRFVFFQGTTSATHLVSLVRFDIDNQRSPLVPALQGSYLPAWRARGYSGYHALVIYGWNVATKQPYRLYVYDPLNVSWSGAYNLPASTIYGAMRAEHNDLVW